MSGGVLTVKNEDPLQFRGEVVGDGREGGDAEQACRIAMCRSSTAWRIETRSRKRRTRSKQRRLLQFEGVQSVNGLVRWTRI